MAVVDGLRVVLCRPGDSARMWLLTSILCPTSSSRLLSSLSITSMLCCFSRVIKKREPFFRRARVRRGWRWEVSLLAPSRSVVCGAQRKEERRGEVKLVGFRHACLSQTTLSWPAKGAKSGGHVRVDMAFSKSSLKDNGPRSGHPRRPHTFHSGWMVRDHWKPTRGCVGPAMLEVDRALDTASETIHRQREQLPLESEAVNKAAELRSIKTRRSTTRCTRTKPTARLPAASGS